MEIDNEKQLQKGSNENMDYRSKIMHSNIATFCGSRVRTRRAFARSSRRNHGRNFNKEIKFIDTFF